MGGLRCIRIHLYDDLSLHEAVLPVADDAVLDVGDRGVLARLDMSSVSKSSSPKLLEVVLLGGDCRVLRRTGADL